MKENKLRKSSFVEGTFIATFCIVLVKIMGMLYVIPFYKMVGTQGAALYAYAYSIYNMFLDISTVGLPIAISKVTKEYNTLEKYDAKARAYKMAMKLMRYASILIFAILFIFAGQIGHLIIHDLKGGNTPEGIASVIRCVSFAILVIPYLSVTKGYLQGHNVINIPSVSNVIEQVIRIGIILLGCYLVIDVWNKSYLLGVQVALTGASISGLIAYLYVRFRMNRNKEELSLGKLEVKDNITNKEIAKKIWLYALPYIIINCMSSLYGFADMLEIMYGLDWINIYETQTIEFIATSASTWCGKINVIVLSIAMGMTMSLIPNIVESFTLKDWKGVNSKINTSLRMITFIALPMTIGLSLLSKPVWVIFYGNYPIGDGYMSATIGSHMLSVSVFIGLAINYYMISSSILQSLNKFKEVYLITIVGFLFNLIFNIPALFLFKWIGIPCYLGVPVVSACGYSISSIFALHLVKKDEKSINYIPALKTIGKILIPSICMLLVVLISRHYIPLNLDSKLHIILYLGINSLIGAIIYLLVSWRMNLFNEVFGEDGLKRYTNKIFKIFKRKKN